jgi:putative exporter of polyketide antibiotics
MKPLDTDKNNNHILKGMAMAVAAGFVIAITLVLIGLVSYYSHKYQW